MIEQEGSGWLSDRPRRRAAREVGRSRWLVQALHESVVIPSGQLFGYLIELGELLIGMVMVAATIAWLKSGRRFSAGVRTTLLIASAAAALAGILMNVSFHLANGSPHPWFIPKEGFDEGIDLDSLMPAIQVVLIVVSLGLLPAVRRGPSFPTEGRSPRGASPSQ